MRDKPADLADGSAVDEDDLWEAVLARDASYDGALVYAVKSTGVYCRPTCASRRPKRANVSFFATAAEARAAGFRACKRCRPDDAAPGDRDRAVLATAEWLDAHAGERATLADLATRVGLSPGHLQRVFTRVYGRSPRQYQAALRGAALKQQLRESAGSVSDAGYAAGFGSSRALYEHAHAALGMSPAAYRRGGAGLTIRYAVAVSPLGSVVVGATQRGVCAVLLADDDVAAVAALVEEFPAATLIADDAAAEWTQQVVDYVSGVAATLSVPLDLQGTEFQRRVWAALRRLPAGSTASYHEVAEALGEPSASRAVAGACAANHIAVIVPCHRVVRSDGGLGGYRWGVERKRVLLERESGDPRP